ncbi:DUF58 domain-containing protein [Leifsonia sp. H3M29-4]|uniref:DUF58 domain-containing protein n=1 Tax=Salinibacterium metalliresistens TaxID=3031321 RepID=UPI0023DC3240|nr:DUF58 domain-containing protein [Salinibacterium metalliresistens]MDF1479607.1 DUF58 domain-containing protein [Salinibacterium metalliresistens]
MSGRPASLRARFAIAGVALTGRGAAFAVLGVLAVLAAYASGRPLLLAVGILLLALPVLAVVVVRMRRPKFAVSRHFAPEVVAAGHGTSVRLRLTNRARTRSTGALWWERLPWGATNPRRLPSVPAGRTLQLDYELRPPRRGVFGIGPLVIEFGDPFGLVVARIEAGGGDELVVTPEVVALGESTLTVPAGSGEAQLVQRRAAGDDDDVMTREYRTGDAMRRVHWRATARHGELMVRQEEQRSLPRARVLVDTLTSGYRGDDDAFEWVVRMLASVTVHLRRAGFDVTVEESGEPQLHPIARRRTWGDEEFLASLAPLQPVDEHRNAAPQQPVEGPVVAIVGEPDAATFEWLSRRRVAGSLAVAFMVRSASSLDVLNRSFGVPTAASGQGDRLLDEGWLVVPVRADDDHAAAWDAVVIETGRSRAPR